MIDEELCIKIIKEKTKDARVLQCYWKEQQGRYIVHVAGTTSHEVGTLSRDDKDLERLRGEYGKPA